MDISINSFPRSGSQFAKLNLDKMIGHQCVAKNPPRFHDILRDRSKFQVAIVRNPRDTVISCAAHAEYNDPGSIQNIKQVIVDTLGDYCKAIDLFIENIDYLNLYDFNYLEWAIFDIANKAKIDVPDGFVLSSNLSSMADTDFYQKVFSEDLDDSLFEEANAKYKTILELCQRPAG